MDKIKVLFTGPVNGQFSSLKTKLESLQSSKAGPFDMCFCVGPFFNDGKETENPSNDTIEDGMPLPVYFCDGGIMPSTIVDKIKHDESSKAVSKDDAEISIDDDSPEKKDVDDGLDVPRGIVPISSNVYFLHGITVDQTQTADILNIPVTGKTSQYLTVAFFPPKARLGSVHTAKLESKTNHPSYIGCDVLLSSEWGQGIASSSCFSPEDKAKLYTGSNVELGSFDIAEVASHCRPRYHIAPSIANENGEAFFLQSLPYSNPPSALASGVLKNYHTSRFLALSPVVDAIAAKANGKTKKFIHALGIQPLWAMDHVTATAVPENTVVVPSPYTDESYKKDKGHDTGREYANIGLSDAQTRRILNEDITGSVATDQYRWNMNRKRPLESANVVDPSNCSLFLHGLHNDVTRGANVNPDSILRTFQKDGCIRVRYPGGATAGNSSYAFLDFATHEEASRCLAQSGGQAEVGGVMLTMKWSSGGNRKVPPPPPPGHVGIYQQQKKPRLTEAEAVDSSSLFVHLSASELDSELLDKSMTYIATIAQTMLENAVNEGVDDAHRVTADDDPALKVTSRILATKQNCAFLDFASHAAASMALAVMTGSTDGGDLQHDSTHIENKLDESIRNVQLWWARPKDVSLPTDDYKSKDGFVFKQQHYPPDARKDCWFCLASPTCQKHLIVSVNDYCYVTMPKGPVNDHHSLIVPVNHSASDDPHSSRHIIGAFMDPSPGLTQDLENTKEKLRTFARDELGKDLFVFERAIPTRGGYHAHVNCIPIDKGLGPQLRTEMMKFAAASNEGRGFQLREIQSSDVSIHTILSNANEDGELNGYFYAEIPYGDNDIKRFLYIMNDGQRGNGPRNGVPLQFGREVLSSVLGDPKLAHWKGCEQSQEIEAQCTEAFRRQFGKY